ncbi:hypothetical protein KAR10_06400 [bacterium]|nr:hypothetical protein [bacterium]
MIGEHGETGVEFENNYREGDFKKMASLLKLKAKAVERLFDAKQPDQNTFAKMIGFEIIRVNHFLLEEFIDGKNKPKEIKADLAFRKYTKAATVKPMSREEEIALIGHIQAGNELGVIAKADAEKLIAANISLVINRVEKFKKNHSAKLSLEKLIRAGNFGLIKAALNY